ncbi:MAG: hypothetical protein KatS3mg002_1021 [Candidatus Woesearchaeota archaeon]|nr:MAG: hypothetical protein KatS3mg002_1021 [Candidatus Woesearchaeota archaeon]
MKNNLLEKALEYASMGFYVFPCREKEIIYGDKVFKVKSPYIEGGFKNSTINEREIINFWKRFPEACIGIACGKSNLFVIDIDIKNNRDGIRNFMKLGIDKEGALESRTPSGGWHIVFSSTRSTRTTTNTRLGIDTRGTGGYIIAPPSYIYDGNSKKYYLALTKWDKIPREITEEELIKLNSLKNYQKKKENQRFLNIKENLPKIINSLDRIKHLSDNYQDWITIGMALYSLGDKGLKLWDEWSKNSIKYQSGVCEEKWKTFNPEEISLGTIFFLANERSEHK